MEPSSTPSAGLAVSSSYQFYRQISVSEIENGFLVSFYTTKNFTFHCSDLDAVKAKLSEVFAK